MFLLLLLLPIVAHRSCGSQEVNATEVASDPLPEAKDTLLDVTDTLSNGPGGYDETGNVTDALEDAASPRPASPRAAPRGPRLVRRRPRRSRRFRPGSPRYRDAPPYNPAVYNPYYRVPQTYYDAYYNPYQGYYPEYAQSGYYPVYPYQPQQPYPPQPYPHPPPPPIIPTPPPTLAPIPDLYYVQNTDGHYQYRRVSVTRRSPDAQWAQYSPERRSGQDYRYPRRPGRLPSEFLRAPRLTSAPHKARVFGLNSDTPATQPTETGGG